ncbi:hypothetical protein AMTRI_Chr11g100320 [Amborella trichopoda]
MVRSKVPFWDYCEERRRKLYCNFCGEGFSTGITRFKYHLSREQGNDIKACPQVPDDVQARAVSATHEVGFTLISNSVIQAEQKTVYFSELLKYYTWYSNIFDGVALGLLSTAHPPFHWFEWLPLGF